MSAIEILYHGVLQPRLLLSRLLRNFHAGYFIMAIFALALSEVSVNVASHLADSKPLSTSGLFLMSFGSTVQSFLDICLVALIIHGILSAFEKSGDILKLISWIAFAQLPFTLLVAWVLSAYSLGLYFSMPDLGMTVFLVVGFVMFLKVLNSIVVGIQANYGVSYWGYAFMTLAVAVFFQILFALGTLVGTISTVIGVFLNFAA